jgi:hypothetical protein
MRPVDIAGAVGSGRFRPTCGWLLCVGMWIGIVWVAMPTGGYAFDAPPSGSGPLRELRAGVAAHDMDGLWSGDAKEDGPDIRLEAVFNHRWFDLLATAAYPHAGATLNTRGNTSCVFAGFLLQWELTGPVFLSTGLDLALHDGERDTDRDDRKSLGSRILFRVPIEVGVRVGRHHTMTLAFDHVSNAYLFSPNDGLDTLGLIYGFRF